MLWKPVENQSYTYINQIKLNNFIFLVDFRSFISAPFRLSI